MARAKAVKSETRRGIRFGVRPPFAQRGVPDSVSMTSWPWSCAERIASSRSSNRYDGSNGSAGLEGRFGATRFHPTSRRTIVAPSLAARAARAFRSFTQR